MKMKFSLLIVAASLMVGCGEEAKLIEDVKKRPINAQLTYAQAFEKSYCEDNEWELEKDENNRDVVKYTCSFTINSDEIKNSLSAKVYSFGKSFFNILWNDPVEWLKRFTKELNTLEMRRLDLKYHPYDEVKARQQLADDYGINTDAELDIAIDALKKHKANDAAIIETEFVEKYTASLMRDIPDHLKVKKVMSIVLLPDNKENWFAPVFNIEGLDGEYATDQYSLLTREVTESPNKELVIETLLDRFFTINNNGFYGYLVNECTSECSLTLPFLDYYFGEVTEEGDDWDN